MYVDHGRAKPVLRGQNSTEPNLFHHRETTFRFDDCLNMLLSCFRKRMSGRWLDALYVWPTLLKRSQRNVLVVEERCRTNFDAIMPTHVWSPLSYDHHIYRVPDLKNFCYATLERSIQSHFILDIWVKRGVGWDCYDTLLEKISSETLDSCLICLKNIEARGPRFLCVVPPLSVWNNTTSAYLSTVILPTAVLICDQYRARLSDALYTSCVGFEIALWGLVT